MHGAAPLGPGPAPLARGRSCVRLARHRCIARAVDSARREGSPVLETALPTLSSTRSAHLAADGSREATLLGQTVNADERGLTPPTNLAELFTQVNNVEEIAQN